MSRPGEQPGIGIPGITGFQRGRTWDAVASAHAPELPGDSVAFVALADGSLVVDADVPDDSLGPLADALEEHISPPYRAEAVRDEGDVWSVSAQQISIVEVSGVEGDVIDLSMVGGVRELSIDGKPTTQAIPALDALLEQHGEAAVQAERVDGDLFTVDVFSL